MSFLERGGNGIELPQAFLPVRHPNWNTLDARGPRTTSKAALQAPDLPRQRRRPEATAGLSPDRSGMRIPPPGAPRLSAAKQRLEDPAPIPPGTGLHPPGPFRSEDRAERPGRLGIQAPVRDQPAYPAKEQFTVVDLPYALLAAAQHGKQRVGPVAPPAGPQRIHDVAAFPREHPGAVPRGATRGRGARERRKGVDRLVQPAVDQPAQARDDARDLPREARAPSLQAAERLVRIKREPGDLRPAAFPPAKMFAKGLQRGGAAGRSLSHQLKLDLGVAHLPKGLQLALQQGAGAGGLALRGAQEPQADQEPTDGNPQLMDRVARKPPVARGELAAVRPHVVSIQAGQALANRGLGRERTVAPGIL